MTQFSKTKLNFSKMATIPFTEVISFSSEHSVNKVNNLIKGQGKWTTPFKNVSSLAKGGNEILEIEAEFKMPTCKIEAIDIGNFWTATLEIYVGRSGESASSRVALFKNECINLMTRIDCHSGKNAETMNFYELQDINPKAAQSGKGWDRLKVVCKQRFRNDVLFGLSALSIRGQKLDSETPDKTPVNSVLEEQKIAFQDSTSSNQPGAAFSELFIQGSRASKMIEKSLKNRKCQPLQSVEKENILRPMSSQRKRLREDDLMASPTASSAKPESSKSRNDIILQDSFSPTTSSERKAKAEKFQFSMSKKVTLTSVDDFLNFTEDELKASGVLVQKRSYKKPKSLPLKNGQELTVGAGQSVTFFKQGKVIVMSTKNQLYDPLVEPEFVRGIFKDYTEEQVWLSDFQDSQIKEQVKQFEEQCPLCQTVFYEEQKLMQHAANCNGLEELVQDQCPICQRDYAPEMLPQHAQECAQQMFD